MQKKERKKKNRSKNEIKIYIWDFARNFVLTFLFPFWHTNHFQLALFSNYYHFKFLFSDGLTKTKGLSARRKPRNATNNASNIEFTRTNERTEPIILAQIHAVVYYSGKIDANCNELKENRV